MIAKMGQRACIIAILSVFLLTAIGLGATLWLHGPRTCSDAIGYIMGGVSLRHHGTYLWFATDDELRREGYSCLFDCPKNSRDVDEYKRDKTQGYQTHWAPGYPATVAFLSRLLNIDVRFGYWLLHLVSLGTLAAMFWRMSDSRERFTAFQSWLIAAIPLMQFMWMIGMVAFSEVLFLPVAMASVLLLERYVQTGRRRWLLFSVSLCGFGILIRYAGVYQIGAAVLILMSEQKKTWKRRVVDGALYGALAAIPLLLWQWRNWTVTGGLRGSRVSELALMRRLYEGFRLTGEVFFPVPPEISLQLPSVLLDTARAIPSCLVITVLGWLLWRCRSDRTVRVFSLSALSYIGFIWLTNCWTGEPYPFDFRVLLPAILPGMAAAMRAWQRTGGIQAKMVRMYATAFLLVSFLWNTLYCVAFLSRQINCAMTRGGLL